MSMPSAFGAGNMLTDQVDTAIGRKLHIKSLLGFNPMSTAEKLWELLPEVSRNPPNDKGYSLEAVKKDLELMLALGGVSVDDSGRYQVIL